MAGAFSFKGSWGWDFSGESFSLISGSERQLRRGVEIQLLPPPVFPVDWLYRSPCFSAWSFPAFKHCALLRAELWLFPPVTRAAAGGWAETTSNTLDNLSHPGYIDLLAG